MNHLVESDYTLFEMVNQLFTATNVEFFPLSMLLSDCEIVSSGEAVSGIDGNTSWESYDEGTLEVTITSEPFLRKKFKNRRYEIGIEMATVYFKELPKSGR